MRRILCAISVSVVAGCTGDTDITPPKRVAPTHQLSSSVSYVVDTLPSLAGTSRGSHISNRGLVAGLSTTGTGIRRAALWDKDGVHDLGTLGTGIALRSTVQWLGQNNTGMVVGISQTDDNEQYGEEWSCAPFLGVTGKICLGFVWENDAMQPLETLGGPNGYAAAVNNRGQIVGWSETQVVDPTCTAPQRFQFLATLWEPKKGIKSALLPLSGHSSSAATAINQGGRVVGISGDCDVAVGAYSAREAVLWDHDQIVVIPNLGGEIWHTPTAVNDSGDVVGFSNPTGVNGRTFLPHPFLWTGGATSQDLGLLSGDDNGQAFAINNKRQVVGVSCLGNACRGFLWENDVMRDFRDVVGTSYPGVFTSTRSITDDGRITGSVRLNNGATRAFIATPVVVP